MKKTAALLLTLLLSLPLSISALAADYPDLDESHWAYDALIRACELGILGGMPDGTVQPSGTLTWGQDLAMLGRAFYPTVCDAHSGADSHWAMPYYLAACEAGVLQADDFLPVASDKLDMPLLRRDAAVLLSRLLPQEPASPGTGSAFVDWETLPVCYREAVSAVSACGLISGMPDGSFQGEAPLLRADGAVLLLRLSDLRGGAPSAPIPEHEAPAADLPASLPGEQSPSEDPDWRVQGENQAKYLRLFGSADQRRFTTKSEADARMKEVTVPVWHLDPSTGERASSACTFTIHEALADDMTAIFTAIYEDPEQFPIKNIGGYRWTDAAKGEHNCGTAVDINWEENYQIYDSGQVGAGSHWLPGEDPFSIPADGSVVRIFAQYGYSWGGTAWAGSRDYMHFSYMGK